MNELVKLVVQKTGITEAQAKTAVETVIGFLKQKLPAPLGSQLDSLLGSSQAGDVLKGLGGMLGGKK